VFLSFVPELFVNPFLNFFICLSHHLFFLLSGKILLLFHSTKRVRMLMFRTIEESPNCRIGRIITSQLQHLCSSLISPCQHGFVKRRSTTTNLLEFTSFVLDGFNKKLQTDVIYTDFSKAFDSVNHSLLLFKLDLLGFPNNQLTWISRYLNGRSQRVLFKNAVSKMINVTSGVPQGCHLGPLLFTLLINDLQSIVNHSHVLMYADDVKLCFSYNNIESGFCLQSDINIFQEWCQYNLLNFNYLKCNVMTIYRGTPTFMSYFL